MIPSLLSVSLFLQQTPTKSLPVGWIVAGLAVGGAGAIITMMPLIRRRKEEVSRLSTHLAELKQEKAKLSEESKQRAKKLDSKREEIGKLKKDLAQQRKKTHTAQLEAKDLRNALKESESRREAVSTSRPAFAEPQRQAPQQAPEPQKPAPLKPEPVSTPDPRLEELEAQVEKLKQQLANVREEHDQAKREVKTQRRRSENFRRIDVLNSGKMQTLEDRLKELGLKYYDAVSEIAALKGEVTPVPAPEVRAGLEHREPHAAS